MATLDQLPNQDDEQMEQAPDNEQAEDADVSSRDVEIAVRLGIKMLNDSGLQVIKDALDKSQDPAQVIGQFLAQLMGKMAEELQAKIGLDPRVFLAKRGFLETILDYIEGKLGYPSDFSDKVYGEVLEVIKAAAQQPPPPNNVMGGQALDQPMPGGQQ